MISRRMIEPREPELAELAIADPPERWQALGFDVEDGLLDIGGVRIRLGQAGHGITSWSPGNTRAASFGRVLSMVDVWAATTSRCSGDPLHRREGYEAASATSVRVGSRPPHGDK